MLVEQIDLLEVIGRDSSLIRKASTHGGEFKGPCPFCGGRDRFTVWPEHPTGRGRFWCRKCDVQGDAIDYIRLRDRCNYHQARERLGVTAKDGDSIQRFDPGTLAGISDYVHPPSETWQVRGWEFIAWAQIQLWEEPGTEALAYLKRRGLADQTIQRMMLGYNPEVWHDPAERWDLEGKKPVYLPAGIVIPNESCEAANIGRWSETLWGIRIRLLDSGNAAKYLVVKGSRPALYGADAILHKKPVVLMEGELDALTCVQQVPDVTTVATGSTSWCRRLLWITLLNRSTLVVVAFDADDAGNKASQWWLDMLGDKAKRWLPWWDDANGMHQSGVDLRLWLAPALDGVDTSSNQVEATNGK